MIFCITCSNWFFGHLGEVEDKLWKHLDIIIFRVDVANVFPDPVSFSTDSYKWGYKGTKSEPQ